MIVSEPVAALTACSIAGDSSVQHHPLCVAANEAMDADDTQRDGRWVTATDGSARVATHEWNGALVPIHSLEPRVIGSAFAAAVHHLLRLLATTTSPERNAMYGRVAASAPRWPDAYSAYRCIRQVIAQQRLCTSSELPHTGRRAVTSDGPMRDERWSQRLMPRLHHGSCDAAPQYAGWIPSVQGYAPSSVCTADTCADAAAHLQLPASATSTVSDIWRLLGAPVRATESAELRAGLVAHLDFPLPTTATLMASGFSRGQHVLPGDATSYCLYVDAYYTDGSNQYGLTAAFAPGTHEWIQQQIVVPAAKPLSRLTVAMLLQTPGDAEFAAPSVRMHFEL